MKTIFKSLLILSSLLALPAHAMEEEDTSVLKVNGTSIKLIGRGIENRQTKETLALACVTENCSALRTVVRLTLSICASSSSGGSRASKRFSIIASRIASRARPASDVESSCLTLMNIR